MKILVNVSVPAIFGDYDILIPSFLTIGEIIPLIANAVEELSNSMYKSSGNESLCHAERAVLLNQNITIKEYGIQNGDHLVLI